MHRLSVYFLALVSAIALVYGCAAPQTRRVAVDPSALAREQMLQRRLILERQGKDQMRALRVGRPILASAVPLCGENVRPTVGLVAATVHDFDKKDAEAARDLYEVGDQPKLIAVIPGGPAERAGLEAGDTILSINDQPVSAGRKATKAFTKLLTEQLSDTPMLSVAYERRGQRLDTIVDAEASCGYPIVVSQDDIVNAYADGDRIVITKGMMRFAETDVELATVIGHELAHNAMGHIDSKMTNFALGSVFDILAAAYGVNTQGAFGNAASQAYSQDFEAEADYVGMYALALAELPLDEAPNFWRRMAAEGEAGVETQYGSSHPGSAERYLALEATAREIDEKKREGLNLQPNLKKDDGTKQP